MTGSWLAVHDAWVNIGCSISNSIIHTRNIIQLTPHTRAYLEGWVAAAASSHTVLGPGSLLRPSQSGSLQHTHGMSGVCERNIAAVLLAVSTTNTVQGIVIEYETPADSDISPCYIIIGGAVYIPLLYYYS